MADNVKQYLGKRIRVTLSDDRVFLGTFYCLDYLANIILDCATEEKPVTNSSSSSSSTSNLARNLGTVLVPHEHLVKCELAIN